MDSIHQAILKGGHLLHKITLVQSQRNGTVCSYAFGKRAHISCQAFLVAPTYYSREPSAKRGIGCHFDQLFSKVERGARQKSILTHRYPPWQEKRSSGRMGSRSRRGRSHQAVSA